MIQRIFNMSPTTLICKFETHHWQMDKVTWRWTCDLSLKFAICNKYFLHICYRQLQASYMTPWYLMEPNHSTSTYKTNIYCWVSPKHIDLCNIEDDFNNMYELYPSTGTSVHYLHLKIKILIFGSMTLTYIFVDLKFKLDFEDYNNNTITCKNFSVHPNPTLLGFST